MDVKFAPSCGDSPKDLTVSLPAGPARERVDRRRRVPDDAPDRSGAGVPGRERDRDRRRRSASLSFSAPVTLDLVAPPKAGDLAGIAIFLSLADTTPSSGRPGM